MIPFRALPILLALAACGAPVAYNAVEGPRGGASLSASQLQAQGVQAVNVARAQAGIAPVIVNPQLQTAAQNFAAQPGEVTILSRARTAGYTGCVLSETLASGQSSAEAALSRWLASSSERDALMSSGSTEIGLGVAPDPAGGNRWALALGTPC